MDTSAEHPYRIAEKRLNAEIAQLHEEWARKRADLAAFEAKVKNREEARNALSAILLERSPADETLPLLADTTDKADPEETGVRFTASVALRGVPREGYGAITQAVQRLLNYNPSGVSAKTLADVLKRNGFQVKGEGHEAAVRSALKNLRGRGLAVHSEATGRYQSTHRLDDSATSLEAPLTRADAS